MFKNFNTKNWVVIVGICLLLTIFWFHAGLIKGGGEEGLAFYNPSRTYQLSQTMWWDYDGGWPTLAWLAHLPLFLTDAFLYQILHIPNYLLQAATIFIFLSVGGIATYFLTKQMFQQKKSNTLALLSAIFYILNPFSMSQIWGRGLTSQYASFALLPLALFLFLRGLKNKNIFYLFVLSIVAVLFSSAFGITTFIIVYWVVLGIGWISWFTTTKKETTKDILFSLCYFILAFFLWCITNAYWLLPTLFEANKIYAGHIINVEENIGTLLGVSRNYTPFVLSRLLQDTYFFAPSALSSLYFTLPFQAISLLLPLFLLIGLFAILKKKNLNTGIVFVVLLLIGYIVCSGANPPLGWLFVWIFNHVTFLQAFRNPYEKFGIVYALGYSPIFSLGVIYFFTQKFVKSKIKFLGIFVTIFLVCGIYLFPMWNGRLMTGQKVQVPEAYKKLNHLLDRDGSQYRVALLPFWPGDGAFYQWGNTKYQGIDPTMYLLDAPVISSNPSNFPFFSDFMQSVRENIYKTDISGALSLLRVKYLIARKDAINLSSAEKQHQQFLTDAIYPPANNIDTSRVICQDKTASSSGSTNPAWIVCDVSPKEGNWRNVKYLQVSLKVNTVAYLDLAVRDMQENRPRWYGRFGDEYKLAANTWTTLLLPIGVATEVNYATDFSKIKEIEVQAHPIDSPNSSVERIDLKKIVLDEGEREPVHNYAYLKTFDNLRLYRSLHDTRPPEFGLLQSLEKVDTFGALVTKAKEKQNILDKHGFLLTTQNQGKDTSIIAENYPLKIKNIDKISDTKYVMEVKQSGVGILLLSEAFHPEWKVIPSVTQKELQDTLWNNLKLLQRSTIPEKDHYVVNGYANAWKIENNSHTFAVVFMPQIYAAIGRDVSFGSLFCVLLYVSVSVVRKQYRKRIFK